MDTKKVYHLISNTHWDREWRYPFERNRQMLVRMMDSAIDILERNPEFRAYHLDSQSVMVKDYLEMRPDRKETVIKLVKNKRLIIGPWFILPDEFQVGGENLIRNLLLGHRISNELGGVSKVGYSPFSWGQISQLPQIYAGFGIDVIMFYRGVNSLDSPKAEFIWQGADGTRALSSRFSTMPRYNFYFYVYRPVIHNQQPPEIESNWKDSGIPFHFADIKLSGEDYSLITPRDNYYKNNLKEAVEKIIRDQANDFTTPNVIWMEGHDSSGPNEKTIQILEDIKELFPALDVRHSTLEEYAGALKASVDPDAVSPVTGERRSTQYDTRSSNLYGYTTSARMFLKQMNFEAERWLQFYAEPFNSITGLLGYDINDRYTDHAWELIIQNSAHDSIGGCSLDEVHEDMMNRYKRCIETSMGLFERACKRIGESIDLSDHPDGSIHLVALNPNSYIRSEVAEAYIDIPENMDRGNIELRDPEGRKIPHQLIGMTDEKPVLEELTNRPTYFSMKRYRCYLDLTDIPPVGYKTFHITPLKKKKTTKNKPLARRVKKLPVLENDHIRAIVNPNGTLIVKDKTTGAEFDSLAYLYDEGEAGHAWVHTPVEPYVNTLRSKPEITLLENGTLKASVSIKHTMNISASLEDRQYKRSQSRKRNNAKKVKLPVEIIFSITKHSRRIDITVKLTNTAEDHRLRVMFPTGLENATHHHGEGQFDVVRRPIERPDTDNWVEQPMYDYPMHHFADVSDGSAGAAVLVDGLKEYEVKDDRKRTLAITLLRAFTYIIQPSSVEDYAHQKGSQCAGEHVYRLAFYPHKDDWDKGGVYREALNFNNDLRLFQMGKTEGRMPPQTSIIRIEPEDIVLSCFKESERHDGSYIMRLYNPTERDIQARVGLCFDIENASFVTIEEKHVEKIPLSHHNEIHVHIAKKKIVTMNIKFRR